MSIKQKIFLFAVLVFTASPLFARDVVSLVIEIRESWKENPQDYIVADFERAELLLEKENQVFVGNVSLVIIPRLDNLSRLEMEVDIFSLPPRMKSLFTQAGLSRDKELKVASLDGKVKRSYDIIFKDWQIAQSPNRCQDDPFDTLLWAGDFSTHFNTHYYLNSLADYYWNFNQTYLENEFSKTRKEFDIYPITRIELFYHHCLYPLTNWNKELGTALFPAKKQVRIIYTPEQKTIGEAHLQQLMFLNEWGYAPLFLTYGLAGYFSPSHFYAQKELKENKLIPLDSLLNSASYRRQNQIPAFDQASSFVKYLIEKYSKDKLREFYKDVSDLNVKESISRHFDRFEKVKSDWLEFLANFQPQSGELLLQAKLEAGIRNYRESVASYEDVLKLFVHQDLYPQIGNAYYLVGNYRQAAEYYQRWLRADSLNAQRQYVLGNMLWLDGQAVSARKYYLKAVNLDSNFSPAIVKLAQQTYDANEYEACRNWLTKLGEMRLDPVDELEFRMLKSRMEAIDNKKDSAAESGWKATMIGRNLVIQTPEEPLAYLLAGQAYLWADSLKQAEEYLKVAELLEDRAYYSGQVRLALGELYYKNKDSESARKYLQSVLETPSGYREKQAAQNLLTRF